MGELINILDKTIIVSREEEYIGKKKTSFWASESETMAFEIYHRWICTPPTNPITGEKLMMLKMRKLTEEAIVNTLRKSGQLIEELANEKRCYFEWGPKKVPISGYPDAGILLNNEKILIEIKTYYGGYQHAKIRIGQVKTSYLKQLAIYMYYFKIKRGILVMVNQGTGERFEYELYQKKEYHYICPDNDQEINLRDTFKRFEKIYTNNILPSQEPCIEYQYKYKIENIDWTSLSSDKIRKARSNAAVVGDWQIKYSDFKDLIIKKQKTISGYTPEELTKIKELTAGYSTRKANMVRFDPSELK